MHSYPEPTKQGHHNKSNIGLWAFIGILSLILVALVLLIFKKNDSANTAYTHESEAETLQYTEQQNSVNEYKPSAGNKHDRAVAELKDLLSKAEGMKFGSSEMVQTSASYDEKRNIVEFRFTQRIFPRSVETPKLIEEVSKASRDTRKQALRKITNLMRLMEPLRPTIRDVVCYPDGGVAYSYDIVYNDLYFDD